MPQRSLDDVAEASSTESYVAFVATARDGAVAAIPLGPAAALDSLIAEWRTAISGQTRTTESEYRTVASRLRERLWDPVAGSVNGASLVFVVPDGAVNLVSFGALPVGDHYLLENVQGLHYLSAERDLLSARESNARGGLLAMGGIDFVTPRAAQRTAAAASAGASVRASRSGPSVCSESPLARFAPLPGTHREVDEISAVWNASDRAAANSTVLVGGFATEETFKREAFGRSILHLATHGFFFDGDCEPAVAGTRAVGGLTAARPSRHAPTPITEGTFALSGLVLAGANSRTRSESAGEDGILTAEEVLSLNLEGVEWAVLSACDTGLGRIRAGEGVFGLRRAFQIAGVRSVIMSLWAVDDEATRLWMHSLYEGRLVRHLNTARAVRDASIAVLSERRSAGFSTHPFYWAGFVAAGSWR